MRVIDARSGKDMVVGDVIEYGDGERIRLLDVDEGLFSANAMVELTFAEEPGGRLFTRRVQIPLTVRFLHPAFLFQRVAFISS